jgi:RNA polymerase sigma-70 factor, ECF subfamily
MTVMDVQDAELRRADVRRSCESVFREHNEALIRFAFKRLGSSSWDAARDLVQTAYEKIFAQDAPPPFKHLRAYIYKAVGNLCLDARRTLAVRSLRQQQLHDVLYAAREVVDPEKETLAIQVRGLLNAALMCLPPRERMAFTLVEMKGFTVQEAAEIMDVEDRDIYTHVARAYAHLARTVTKRRITPSRPSQRY